ncbi:MAG: ethanolamine utilization protein EutN [Dethiosulfovibrio peptidovorans]|nr:MAG: ethanolamine utilization protein EutN [Dethiosulfovibrio peptidovorans]
MIIAKVVGNIWATKKEDGLTGMKFLVVRPTQSHAKGTFVAIDAVGAGIGEDVIVCQGSSARTIFSDSNVPVDAVIVGIVDTLEVDESLLDA